MNDYYPFGMGMRGRSFDSPTYRYGFNGKEKNESGEFGSLTTYDYGFRIYNPGIAKFLSVDPLMRGYPMLTPYQYASNRPIDGIDLDGLEWSRSQGEIELAGTVGAIIVHSAESIINTAETGASWVSPNFIYANAVRESAEKHNFKIPDWFGNSDIADNIDLSFSVAEGFVPTYYGGWYDETLEGVADFVGMFGFSGNAGATGTSVLAGRISFSSKTSDLVREVILYRKKLQKAGAKKASTTSNVAILEFEQGGEKIIKQFVATGGDVNHAEKQIMRYLDDNGIPYDDVKRIYSELKPCKTCEPELAKLPDSVEVTWSYDRLIEADVKERGNALQAIWRWATKKE